MAKIPLFKSHYSLGRSILTLEKPEDCEDGGPTSIFKIAKDANLKEVYLVEDNISGFPSAFKIAKKAGLSLRYGQIFKLKSTALDSKEFCKVVLFPKSDEGFKELIKLHSEIHLGEGYISFEQIEKLSANIGLAVPFYDSFLHCGHFTFAQFIYDFGKLKPIFFIEDNGLPIDGPLAKIVENYAKQHGCSIVYTQTILYEKTEDVAAYLTYRLICDRASTRGGVLEKPNIDGFASDKFSWERFKKENIVC